jgi:hypothetical protein
VAHEKGIQILKNETSYAGSHACKPSHRELPILTDQIAQCSYEKKS